jgi:hypothetical protein
MINAKLMICRNSFLVLMLVISIFLVEVILINYMVLMLLSSPTVWLSGSGGTGETPSHYRITSRNALTRERRREAPPERSVGGSRCLPQFACPPKGDLGSAWSRS